MKQQTAAQTQKRSTTPVSAILWRAAVRFTPDHAVPPVVNEVLRSPGKPLDPQTRGFFEPLFGHDFSQVRVHTDAKASESARAVNALAYTFGRNVVFGASQYEPETIVGQRLLAHELIHVAQQGQRDHTMGGKVRIGEQQDAYELEANNSAEEIVRMNCSRNFRLQPPHPEYEPRIRLQPFRDCGDQRITGIPDANTRLDVARRMAIVIVGRALGVIRTITAGTASAAVRAVFTRHFGAPSATQIATIVSRYEFIQRRLPIDRWYICNTARACGGNDAYAWCPGGPYIHICPSFFTDPRIPGPATLIHEAAHIAGACSDVFVGNAGYPPANAQNNADSYALFAWDIRARPSLGPPARQRPKHPSLIEDIIRRGPRVRERILESVRELE